MSTKGISANIKKEVAKIVEDFNRTVLQNDPEYSYVTRYRGKYLYLNRQNYGRPDPICRLTFTGEMDSWEFAIYKYSSEQYDADEWFFPGAEDVDGTIEGAMKASLKAYP